MKNKSTYQLIGSFCLVFFVMLGYLVKFYPATLNGVDSTIQAAIRFNITNQATVFFKVITQMASLPAIILLCLVYIIYLYRTDERSAAIWLLTGTILIPAILVPLFKLVYNRERPLLEHLVNESSNSFPSGHSATAIVFFGSIALISWQILKNRTLKITISIIAALIIILVGVSRIYLGVHYPSDVLAGFLLGGAWLNFSYPIFIKKRVQSIFKRVK
ncbi:MULTISPECIES: phosphatase PAP2 family protein [unclassified Enterococcus]|uniref:phosphatase PAP2 family protein n=1 Tax=unclassified Enterococcus TaxID=2608891 RepID=UPI001557E398|nr:MULTISPECIES: phosphatase PAP2 family protein [unclassified Enterococcus]MBS7578108.1 phosphatase PAP2 family protein [Enterococcus sp. MMGLQ5-2]MBS7585368.1 phosphatase PAP2 family protein [Enterococcus sp. MMGLQ5-1]NPD13225.1 phosphatase PAP2 family protein [Enterococcus sp. MMGLQ5-1]NPD37939.1 phosphatase PAP2 family protein [Enterococcus sp. MMGLQ5-2]